MVEHLVYTQKNKGSSAPSPLGETETAKNRGSGGPIPPRTIKREDEKNKLESSYCSPCCGLRYRVSRERFHVGKCEF